MKELLGYVKPYKKPLIGAILFMLLDVLCEVMQPTLMTQIVGPGLENKNIPFILATGGLMILLALVAIVAGFCNARNSAVAGVGFAAGLRKGLFTKVQSFAFENIDSFSTASLATRLTNDVTLLQNAGIMSLRILIRAPLMFVFAIAMAIRMNARLAVILGIVIPLLLVLMGLIIKAALPRFNKMQALVDKLTGSVQESLRNVRVVKSFVRQKSEKEKFRVANDNLTDASMSAMNIVILTMPVMMLIMNLSTVSVIWLGGNQIIQGSLQVAEMTAFINYIFQILMSLMMLSMMFVMLSRATASLKRVVEVLRTEPSLQSGKSTEKPAMRGEITFEHVSFKYDESQTEPVLKDLTFTAKSGQVVAIVGGTGSGKSSLVQLIPRLYDVSEGRVLVDGVDVRDCDLDVLRGQIGMVLQKNTLFSGTVRDNLKWGDEHATDEQVIAAAKAAQCHDFISELPKGYDSWVEQGGVNFSGGQKQRMCIARAMLKKPAILILDDSTSAVDTATESRIREAFYTDLKGTTVLLIAQRISSVRDADQILVLDGGEIVASGTHDQLLESSEEYREIYESQQEKEAQA